MKKIALAIIPFCFAAFSVTTASAEDLYNAKVKVTTQNGKVETSLMHEKSDKVTLDVCNQRLDAWRKRNAPLIENGAKNGVRFEVVCESAK